MSLSCGAHLVLLFTDPLIFPSLSMVNIDPNWSYLVRLKPCFPEFCAVAFWGFKVHADDHLIKLISEASLIYSQAFSPAPSLYFLLIGIMPGGAHGMPLIWIYGRHPLKENCPSQIVPLIAMGGNSGSEWYWNSHNIFITFDFLILDSFVLKVSRRGYYIGNTERISGVYSGNHNLMVPPPTQTLFTF